MSASFILSTKGDEAILDRPMVALLCSAKCPGKLILGTYDLAKMFRKRGITVISGFHSPMEEECLRILLRSQYPAVWCLARGMFKRIPTKPMDCRTAVAEGRLLIISPFKDNIHQITTKTAVARNRVVADLATVVVVAHASPRSKNESLAMDLLAAGKSVYTFDHSANATILNYGAKNIDKLDFTAAGFGCPQVADLEVPVTIRKEKSKD
jgi:predicted Rossmann fold nucleotide-binding protein DprA/Smf involved in DNA uptake